MNPASFLRRAFGGRSSSAGRSFLAIDGLRGFAVLLVLFGHMDRGGLTPAPSLTLFLAGASGVDLFFVLSSFLLSLPLVAATAAEVRAPRTWLAYAIRRLLRIYPMYALVLVVFSFVPAWSWAISGTHEVPVVDHLLLRQGAKILWAIPVEMKFYALLPLLAITVGAALRHSAAAALGLMVVLVVVSDWMVPPWRPGAPSILLAPQLPYFVCGLAAAVVHLAWKRPGSGGRLGLEAAGLLAFGWWAATNVFGIAVPGTEVLHRPALRGLAFAAFVLAAVDGAGALGAVFRVPPLRFLGVISFSVYLLHMPIVEALRKEPGWSVTERCLSILALTCAVSALSYLLVERPFIDLGRRFPGARLRRGDEATAQGRTPAS